MGHNIIKGRIGNAQGIKLIYDENGNVTSLDVGSDHRGEGKAAIIGTER